MITTIIVYLLCIYLFFGVERRLRIGKEAKSWKPGQHDKGSQKVLEIGFAIVLLIFVIAPVLNYFHIGRLDPEWLIGGIGIIVMITGIWIRYWSAKTLGEYYTRTLLIKERHLIIDLGPYRFIRHPGYLGIIIAFIGAALGMNNEFAIVIIPIILIIMYGYRIKTEENMMKRTFGQAYTEYMKRSRRIIPFIF